MGDVERIAIVSVHGCPSAKLGGREAGGMNVYIKQVAEELGRRGIWVDIFTRYHDPQDQKIAQISDHVRVIHITAGSYLDDKNNLLSHLPDFIRGVLNYTKDEHISYDIVHSHYWLSGRIGVVLGRHWRIPHVANFHTLAEVKMRARVGENESEQRSSGERKIIAMADKVLAFSQHEKEAMVRLYGAQQDKVGVIPGGVDTELFSPMDRDLVRKTLGLQNTNIVLYVGRIEPLKGIDILLRAVSQLDRPQPIRTIIIGGDLEDDHEIERLKSLSMDLGIAQFVSFMGRLEQQALPNYYNAADICVVPSYYESFGLVALEAMSCGTPVIASRVGGLPTFVKDSLTGYLIPWHCPEPFTDVLEVLLDSDGMRKVMGKAARETALEMGWPNVVDQLLSLYNKLLDVEE